MVKLKNPLLSLGASNTISKAITFVRRRSQNIAEIKPEILDIKSPGQLSWRHMFLKCTALWNALSAAEKEDWESLARSRHMTGYAYWQSQCLRPNPGIYLPLQGGTMQGDIDMDKYRLLKLPLPTDVQEACSKTYHDALANVPIHGHAQHTDVPDKIFISATSGHTDGTTTGGIDYAVVSLADGVDKYFAVTFDLPADFVSYLGLHFVWASVAAAGNMWWGVRATYSRCGEAYNTHFEAETMSTSPTGGIIIKNCSIPPGPLTFANLAPGDSVGLRLFRKATNPLDTLTATVFAFGFIFSYTANQ